MTPLCDYHMHTTFADGKNTPQEMVEAALKAGLRSIGFSEHAYVPFDPDCCMSPAQTLAYRREIARLKAVYAGQMEIFCGIEMDADAQDDPAAYDYVIGSVHYLTVGGETYSVDLSPAETRRCVQNAFGGDYAAYAAAYFEKVAGLQNADIIGHFDLITKFKHHGAAPDTDDDRCRRAWQAALAALPLSARLEVNTGAMARGYRHTPYPAADILRTWRARGGDIVLSSDAHDTAHLAYAFDMAAAHAKACGYQHLEKVF